MKLLILAGSNRPAGAGARVSKCVQAAVSKDSRFNEVDFVSVSDLNLPVFNEDFSPKYRHYTGKEYTNAAGKAWAERVDAADAFIYISPEYNHSVPGGLKNALDWVGTEWAGKPVGLIGYSITPFGGVRAVEHLRQIAPELGLRPTTNYILIGDVANAIGDDGRPVSEDLGTALTSVLDELATAGAA